MLSRTPKPAAGLLSSRIVCRKCSLPSTVRARAVFLRSRSTASDSSEDPQEHRQPRYTKPRLRREERAKRYPIEVPFLGEDGEVVVLPERKRRQRQLPQVEETPEEEETDKSALPFFLNEVERGDDVDTSDRIETFLWEHQPQAKLTASEWEDLRNKVQSSFTQQQLAEYVAGNFADELDPYSQDSPAGKEDIAPWRPGVSHFLENSNASREGTAKRVAKLQDLKGKQFLAEKILRDCWDLELVHEVGQVDISLPAHSMSLLLNSNHFSFSDLASLHGVKIDVTRSLNLVRVTGEKHVCESVRELIYDATARIRHEDLNWHTAKDTDVKDIKRILTSSFLAWVSKTYGVSFELGSSSVPVKTLYLTENKPGADDARRTLNLAIHDAAPSSTPFSTYVSSSEPMETHAVSAEVNLSWFDRQKRWFRWAMPSTLSEEHDEFDINFDEKQGLGMSIKRQASNTHFFDNHETGLSVELLKLLRQKSASAAHKHPEARETVTAAVGKCLFKRNSSFQDQCISAADLGKKGLPRTFTTDIPRVTSFLSNNLTPHNPDEGLQHHRFRLVPSAFQRDVFPQLELDVSVRTTQDDNGPAAELVMTSAQAVLSERSVDYLLPENSLDVRFTRKLTHDLLTGSESHEPTSSSLSAVQSALQSQLTHSITNNDDVPLPPFTRISLPNSLLLNNTAKTKSPSPLDPNGYTTGEYLFLPVQDIRGTRVHQYDFQDHPLNYSYYDSGPYRPFRTTDISLDFDVSGKSQSLSSSTESPDNQEGETETLEGRFSKFYSSACALAFDLNRARL